MYTDHEIELLYLGRVFEPSGNGKNSGGSAQASALSEKIEYNDEQVERLALGLPINS
jgi:hypothetical protein